LTFATFGGLLFAERFFCGYADAAFLRDGDREGATPVTVSIAAETSGM